MSEPDKNSKKKRIRVRFVEEVTMESEKVEAQSEPVVMKRKRMSGHSFKARFKAKNSKEITPEKSPGIQSETHGNYQETEERVQSVNRKKLCLKSKVISPEDSRTTTLSGIDRLVTEEDIDQETSNVDEQRLHPTPAKVEIVKKNVEKASAREEGDEKQSMEEPENEIEKDSPREGHYENQILPLKNQALKDAENETGKDSPTEEHYENQILAQVKQAVMDRGTRNEMENHYGREECNENHIISQKKQIPAESDIDCIIRKLELSCKKKIKSLKKKQKEKRQEFERIWEEKRSALKKDHELRSAFTRYIHREDSTKMVDKLKILEGEFAEKMENLDHLREVELNALLTEERAAENEERKKIAGWRDTAEACLSSKLRALETNKEVPLEMSETVPDASVECDKPVELTNDSSDDWVDEGDGLLDASVKPEKETDDTPTGGLEKILEPLETQVSKDQIQQGSTIAVIQEQDAHVVEKQNISPIQVDASEDIDNVTSEGFIVDLPDQNVPVVEEDQVASPIDSLNPVQEEATCVVENQNSSPFDVPALDHVDTVTISPSNIDVQDQEPVVEEQVALQIEANRVDTIDSVQSDDAPPIRNGEELHNGSSNVSPSCGQPMSIEVESPSHIPERYSSQFAEIEESGVVPQESTSQTWSNRELPLDAGFESRVAPEANIEASTSSQNVALPQTVVTTVEFSHQAALQPGSFDHLYGQSYLFPDPDHQVTWKSPPLLSVSLQNEMDRIHKETEQLQKSHEDMVAQLRSDREKEIEEVIAQINQKYELKLQESESEFSLKKNGLEKNHYKVLQSKMLSEVFGSTCMGFWSFGLPTMQRGNPAESMQHLAPQNMTRPPPMSTSPGQPVSSLLIAGPNLQAVQQLLLPQSPRPSPLAYQNLTPSPAQNMQQARPLSFTPASRPLAITTITPTGGNPHFSGQTPRLTPPHLQPRVHRPTQFRPIANLPPPAFQKRPQLQGGQPGQLNRSALSSLGLLANVNDLPQMPSNHGFGSSEQSYWARLHNPQGNMSSSGMSTDTICLSDGE